ncbi:MAG: penicillin-binding transpeptidase domain-containing protein [Bacillota bacterium]|nr:penicillin-binding transpeptidase domain-containing protein [Bacillota bacterium]
MKEGKEKYEKRRKSKHMIIACFVGAMGLLLAARLFMLTVTEHDKWQSYADDVSLRAVYETAPRGDILDRNGQVIATSRAVYSVNISRVDLSREVALESAAAVEEVLKEQGEDITTTREEVKSILWEKGYSSYMSVVLAEDISSDTAEVIEGKDYPGVQVSVNYVREYPEGALASHVIGYLGRVSADEESEYVDEKGYRRDALIGKDGIEKLCEDTLKGTDAISDFQVDSTGNVTKLLQKSSAVKGEDVRLSLDLELQKTTEDALEQAIKQAAAGGTFASQYGDYRMTYAKNAAVGAAVALDVKTGEVLAMASYPDFDPNDFAVSISREKWAALQSENPDDPLSPSPLYNVATMSAIQPGSTFKPVTALAALSCGLDRDRYLYDDGYISLGGRTYGCFLWNEKEEKHGYLNLKDAIAVSCNYYFFDIAAGKDFASGTTLGYDKKMSNAVILEEASQLGLGEKTGIEIAERAGSLPTEQLKNKGLQNSLRNHLLAEQEVYFEEELLQDRKALREKIEKIVNWSEKDLTLKEIIGKLKRDKLVRPERAEELARVCRDTYFSQMGWTLGDTFNISIGQGDNAYTTLQMANYMATLGNGGTRNRVSILSNEQGSQGGGDKTAGSAKAASNTEKDYEYIVDAMTAVTKDRRGSLYGAFSSFPYDVAAKTGTAQRSGSISAEDEREYLRRHLHLIAPGVSFSEMEREAERLMTAYPDLYKEEDSALRRAVINLSSRDITTDDIDRYKEKYDSFAWTVALAPAEDPQIAVAVMLVQGKTSSNAAPVAREIIGKYGEISGWEKSF